MAKVLQKQAGRKIDNALEKAGQETGKLMERVGESMQNAGENMQNNSKIASQRLDHKNLDPSAGSAA